MRLNAKKVSGRRTSGTWRFRVSFILAAAVLQQVGVASAADGLDVGANTTTVADGAPIAVLDVGDSVFWDGPYIESSVLTPREADALRCQGVTGSLATCGSLWPSGGSVWPAGLAPENELGCEPPACFEYALDLVGPGVRLRVALDHPTMRDMFEMFVFDPTGDVVDSSAGYYTLEQRIDDPPMGRWTIYVRARDVKASAFRMRAILEAAPLPPGAPRALLPNLKATPPFDLVFGGCQASEIVLHNAERCLRFSAGPANTGDGPLDLRIEDAGATSGVTWQWIHSTDGSSEVRPAGTFVWHTEHLHYHHAAAGDYRLFRVVNDQTGELAPAGEGRKVGFCMADFLIAEWRSFDQDPQGSSEASCFGLDGPVGTKMGLAKGWGDIYKYSYEGNYVDFGANSDGLYLVRYAADPGDVIAELVEDDNFGYAYIRVTGDHIEVLERGHGLSPWDPAKVVTDDVRHPTA